VTFPLCWLLAAEFLDGASRRELTRSYSILGVASTVGGLAGGGLATSLAMRIDPQGFLLLGAALLVGSTAMIGIAQRLFPQRALAHRPPVSVRPQAFWGLLRGRYSLLLLAVAMAASLAGVLIEFHFYLVAATSGNGGRDNAGFFGTAYFLLNLIALVPQLVLVPQLQRVIGVPGSLLVLPSVLLGGGIALFSNISMLTWSFLRVTEGGLKNAIHRPSWEQAFLPLPRPQRAVAKLLIDGAGVHIAQGLAAMAMLVWLHFVVGDRPLVAQSPAWVTVLLLAITSLWIALTRLLGRSLARATAPPGAQEEYRPDIPLPDS
jgi:ATP/ADP translocase